MNLKELRHKKKLTQAQVAAAIGVTQQAYANYESGKREPDNETLLMLSDFLGVSTDYLLGKTTEPNPPGLFIPDELQGVRVAFHRGEFEDLTQEEINALAVIAKTLKEARRKDNG